MRTGGLVTTLVLLAAITPALTQYPGGGGGDGQQQQQGSGGADLSTPQQSPNCDYQHACVFWDLCHNGEVNTGGIGLLDVRIYPSNPVPDYLSHLVCPDTPASICCKIPDPIWIEQGGVIGGGTVADIGLWQGECDVHHSCVSSIHCRNGVINTSGAGLLDPRFGTPQICTIKDPDYLNEEGVCCKFPDPVPHLTCAGQTCVAENTCDGTLIKDVDGYDQQCYLDTVTGTLGTCCEQKVVPLPFCPGNRVCVFQGTCNVDGTVITDGSGLFDVRLHVPCLLDGGIHGICCEIPLPEPVYTCLDEGTSCQDRSSCRGGIVTDAYDNELPCFLNNEPSGVCCEGPVVSCKTDGSYFCTSTGTCLGNTLPDPYGGLLPCYVGGTSSIGECCQTPDIVHDCATGGTNDVCVAKTNCLTTVIVNQYYDDKICYIDTHNTGVCCAAPEPLLTCDAGYSCHPPDFCLGDAAEISTFPDCYIANSNSVKGKCCKLKPIVTTIDSCPGNGVCLPQILCFSDEILDIDGTYKVGSLNNRQACTISGTGLVGPGVCCKNPALPDPDLPKPSAVCGVRNVHLDTRIQNTNTEDGKLGNSYTTFGEFPWQGIIFFSNFTFKCGASLIDNHWLLTAAHCVNGYTPYDLRVRLGEWKVDVYDEKLPYYDANIEDIIVHPDFNSANLHNDIALIKLSQPVDFQYHINEVCLPTSGQVFYGNTRCYATGWGKDAFDGGRYQAKLQKVDLPLVSREECEYRLRRSRLGRYFKLDVSFLCAGGEPNKDACEGDGGGPLVCQDPVTGNYVISGITAAGIGCGQPIPALYVDVQYFRYWIDSIIGTPQPEQQQQTGGGPYRK